MYGDHVRLCPLSVLGLQTQTKIWPTGCTFWVNCYLEIMFFSIFRMMIKCVFAVFVLFTPTTLNPTARHIHSDHPHSSHPISNYHFPSASSPSESSKRAMIVDRIRARVEVPSNSAAEDSGDGMETSSNPGSRKRFPSEMNGNIDEKRRKFLERNRAAAQRCREKRKQWINNLQAEKYNIQEENNKLHVRRVIFRFLAFN